MTDIIVAAGEGWHGITGEMLTSVFDELYNVLPIVVPACLGLLGFRKAWGFVRGMLRGA
jgi:hypothetical protein